MITNLSLIVQNKNPSDKTLLNLGFEKDKIGIGIGSRWVTIADFNGQPVHIRIDLYKDCQQIVVTGKLTVEIVLEIKTIMEEIYG